MRKYHGNPPPSMQPIAEIEHGPDRTSWGLYVLPGDLPDGWVAYKLCAIGSAPDKANYWFSVRQNFFGRSGDLGRMQKHRPELYDELRDLLGIKKWEKKPADASVKKASPVDTSIESEPAIDIGVLRDLWLVTCVPDPLGWDEITLTPTTGDGPPWAFFWNGSAFRDDESWLSFSTRYVRSVGPLEQMLRDLG